MRSRMLGWVVFFFIIAIIAGLLGFTGLADAFTAIAKFIFLVFIILFLLSFFFLVTGFALELITWALLFLIIAIIAGALGLAGVVIISVGIAQLLVVIFLALFIASFIGHFARRSRKQLTRTRSKHPNRK